MASSISDGGPSTGAPEPLWVERRWLTGTQVAFLLAIVVVPAFMVSNGSVSFEPALLAVAAGLFLMMLAIFISPLTVGFGHLRVDDAGLAVWWGGLMKVPAKQLGEVMVVPYHEVGPAARSGRYRGIKIPTGHSSCWVGGEYKPAVFVAQHRPDGQTVGWLLASREPEVVVEALREVRDRHRET